MGHNKNINYLNFSLNSNKDVDNRLEQCEVAKCGDNESDVSIDEERMEAIYSEMNPGDYI